MHSLVACVCPFVDMCVRHGPKLGCQEAEAFTILEAQALTLVNLEAEALVTKPKPGYWYSTL